MARKSAQPAGAERVAFDASLPTFEPAVDILETDKSFLLIADLPGVDEQSLEITFERNELTLRGRPAVSAAPPEGLEALHTEVETGNTLRRIHLETPVQEDQIQARLQDGLLHLLLPKHKPEARRIEVRAN